MDLLTVEDLTYLNSALSIGSELDENDGRYRDILGRLYQLSANQLGDIVSLAKKNNLDELASVLITYVDSSN